MNWKYLTVSAIAVIAFFLFLASAWNDLLKPTADLYLEAITVKPEGSR